MIDSGWGHKSPMCLHAAHWDSPSHSGLFQPRSKTSHSALRIANHHCCVWRAWLQSRFPKGPEPQVSQLYILEHLYFSLLLLHEASQEGIISSNVKWIPVYYAAAGGGKEQQQQVNPVIPPSPQCGVAAAGWVQYVVRLRLTLYKQPCPPLAD